VNGRDKNGKFTSGNSGRPKGSKNKLTLALQEAIEQVEKDKGKSLFRHFVERGYKSDNVLVALVRKLIADKIHTEHDLEGNLKVTWEIKDFDKLKNDEKKTD